SACIRRRYSRGQKIFAIPVSAAILSYTTHNCDHSAACGPWHGVQPGSAHWPLSLHRPRADRSCSAMRPPRRGSRPRAPVRAGAADADPLFLRRSAEAVSARSARAWLTRCRAIGLHRQADLTCAATNPEEMTMAAPYPLPESNPSALGFAARPLDHL